MKRLYLLIMLVCLTIMASAQPRNVRKPDARPGDRQSQRQEIRHDRRDALTLSSVDIHVGSPLGPAGKAVIGADLVFLHRFSPSVSFGGGFGLDYINALDRKLVENKEKSYEYQSELSLPIFLRGRYMFGQKGYGHTHHSDYMQYNRRREGVNAFAQVDAGYRIGLCSLASQDGANFDSANVKGVFAEPQIGLSLGKGLDVSLGVPVQSYQKCELTHNRASSDSSLNAVFTTKSGVYTGLTAHLIITW